MLSSLQEGNFFLENWNASKATVHVRECLSAPEDIKRTVSSNTQRSKKCTSASAIVSTAADDTLSSKTSADVCNFWTGKTIFMSGKKVSYTNTTIDSYMKVPWLQTTMSEVAANCIIRLQVEASLSQFETPARLLDHDVQNSLVQCVGAGILSYIPRDAAMIFNNFWC